MLHCSVGIVCSEIYERMFVPYVVLDHVSLADTKWERKFDRVYSGGMFQGMLEHKDDEPHPETLEYNAYWDLLELGLSRHPEMVALWKQADACTDELLARIPSEDEDELGLVQQELLLHQTAV
jgi:hypothetical protein